jgi:hypothetical protein
VTTQERAADILHKALTATMMPLASAIERRESTAATRAGGRPAGVAAWRRAARQYGQAQSYDHLRLDR